MKATVSAKGQVTIPKALRERLGIRPGHVLEFDCRDGMLIGRLDAVSAVSGILGLENFDVDAAINEMRGGPWDAELDSRGPKRH